MREQELEFLSCKLAEALGWMSFKGFSRYGGADRIFVKSGRCFMVEFKSQRGKQRKNQQAEELLAKLHGTRYYLVRSFEKFREVLITEQEKLKE